MPGTVMGRSDLGCVVMFGLGALCSITLCCLLSRILRRIATRCIGAEGSDRLEATHGVRPRRFMLIVYAARSIQT